MWELPSYVEMFRELTWGHQPRSVVDLAKNLGVSVSFYDGSSEDFRASIALGLPLTGGGYGFSAGTLLDDPRCIVSRRLSGSWQYIVFVHEVAEIILRSIVMHRGTDSGREWLANQITQEILYPSHLMASVVAREPAAGLWMALEAYERAAYGLPALLALCPPLSELRVYDPTNKWRTVSEFCPRMRVPLDAQPVPGLLMTVDEDDPLFLDLSYYSDPRRGVSILHHQSTVVPIDLAPRDEHHYHVLRRSSSRMAHARVETTDLQSNNSSLVPRIDISVLQPTIDVFGADMSGEVVVTISVVNAQHIELDTPILLTSHTIECLKQTTPDTLRALSTDRLLHLCGVLPKRVDDVSWDGVAFALEHQLGGIDPVDPAYRRAVLDMVISETSAAAVTRQRWSVGPDCKS